MSQPITSYQVGPQPSGLDMRVQVNQIMLAILGDNCGPTAPTETYPGMMWGDTTNVRLKRRTNANDGWVNLGPLDDFLSEVRTLAKNAIPAGAIVMWWGDIAKIPAGWLLCNGGNGTPNMIDRFPCGAGGSLGSGTFAGTNAQTLSPDQMPYHSHGVYDPGHAHGVGDPGHAHGVADGGHNHRVNYNGGGPGPNGFAGPATPGGNMSSETVASGTGIGIYGAGTGIWIGGSGTAIGIYASGGSQPFDNRPACIGMWFLMKQATP